MLRVWRTDNVIFTTTYLTFTRVPAKVPDVHQSSGEGAFFMWVAFRMCPRRVTSTPDPDTFEKHRDTHLPWMEGQGSGPISLHLSAAEWRLSGVRKRVVSKSVVSADAPPERKPERGYVRQNHPFGNRPFISQ